MKYFIAYLLIGIIFSLRDYIDYTKCNINVPIKYIIIDILIWPFNLISDLVEVIQEIFKK